MLGQMLHMIEYMVCLFHDNCFLSSCYKTLINLWCSRDSILNSDNGMVFFECLKAGHNIIDKQSTNFHNPGLLD